MFKDFTEANRRLLGETAEQRNCWGVGVETSEVVVPGVSAGEGRGGGRIRAYVTSSG